MEDYRKIINFVKKRNNVIKINEFKNNNINYYYINKLLKDNYIKRTGKGIYARTDCFEDEYYIIQLRYKKVIFSYNTALFLLGETEVTPNKIDITVPREYNSNSMADNIKIHYISKENLYLGTEKIESPYGNKILSYNLERTICDIVKNENSLDKEQVNKIIRNSFYEGKIDGEKLLTYAKKLKCLNKIKAIMEVMI